MLLLIVMHYMVHKSVICSYSSQAWMRALGMTHRQLALYGRPVNLVQWTIMVGPINRIRSNMLPSCILLLLCPAGCCPGWLRAQGADTGCWWSSSSSSHSRGCGAGSCAGRQEKKPLGVIAGGNRCRSSVAGLSSHNEWV